MEEDAHEGPREVGRVRIGCGGSRNHRCDWSVVSTAAERHNPCVMYVFAVEVERLQ